MIKLLSLLTNKSLKDLFIKLKDDLMKKDDEKISEPNAKIEKLESIKSVHENAIDQPLVKCDDNKRYNRRSCLRIPGVEVKEKKTENDVMNTLEKCYSSLNVPFDPNYIGRAYRIGLSYTDNYSEKNAKPIIVIFTSWKARQHFYKSRPRYYTDVLKKPGFFSTDLAKQYYCLCDFRSRDFDLPLRVYRPRDL